MTNGWNVFTELNKDWKTTKRLICGYGIVASKDAEQQETFKESSLVANSIDSRGYHYYHLNKHGDVEYITGSDSGVRNAYTYDAFENIRTSSELIKNRYTYNGEQYDSTTSQYYLRARYYNPLVGRFTQEDVYRGDGLNLYAYCGNNPVMYVDPSGYASKPLSFYMGGFSYDDIYSIDYNKVLKSYVGNPPTDMYDPHAHHILFKNGRGEAQKVLVKEGQRILAENYGIDPIKGKEVLCWAPNRVEGQHSMDTLQSLVNDIKSVNDRGGSYDEMVEVLNKHKNIAQERANNKCGR